MKSFFRFAAQKSASLRLAVEALEDRLLPSGNVLGTVVPSSVDLAKTLSGSMRVAVSATAVSGQLASKVANQPASVAALGRLDLAAKAAAGLAVLSRPLDAQGAASVAMLGEQAMKDLREDLQAAGVSQHDLDRLFGQDFSSPLYESLFARPDQEPSWMSQLPFLSATQGTNPIQVGSAYLADPRTAADAPSADDKSSSSDKVVSQSLPDANNDVHVQYQSGKTVDVSSNGTVTEHGTDGSTTEVTAGSGGDTVVTRSADGTIFTDTPDGVSVVQIPRQDNDGYNILAFDKNDTLMAKGNEGSLESNIFDIQSGQWTAVVHMGEIDAVYTARQGTATPNLSDPYVFVGFVVADPAYRKILEMPNPEAPEKQDISGQQWLLDKFVNSVTLPVSESKTKPDIGKFASRIAAGLMSTVNPNPEAPAVSGAEGSASNPLIGLGPHGGDPIGDEANVHTNPHNGGNPVIVFGIGGPRPKVH
jgi:hypothetical protein